MGGHVAGEVASRVAVEAIEAFIEETTGGRQEPHLAVPVRSQLSPEGNRLKAAIFSRTDGSRTRSPIRRTLRGMARTAPGIARWHRARRAHVGDSRGLCCRTAGFEVTHADHSLGRGTGSGRCHDPRRARHHPWRNVVTRVSRRGDPEIDVRKLTSLRAIGAAPFGWAFLGRQHDAQIARSSARLSSRRHLPAAHRRRQRRWRSRQHHGRSLSNVDVP